MKKYLPYIIVLIIAIVGFAGYKVISKPQEEEKPDIPTRPKIENINQLLLEQRPYILIEPKSKTRPQDLGYWITVSFYNDNIKNYTGVDYDVEYQAGTLIQGFRHSLDFSKEEPPYSKESFFGSESRGKYYYHENMIGGNIVFQLFKKDGSYDALKTNFNIQSMEEKQGVFTSNDVKAVLKVGDNEIADNVWIVIASTLGLPAPIEGEIISEPYGFYAHQPIEFKEATLTVKSSKDLTNAQILGWDSDNEEWVEYETTIKDSEAEAEIDSLGTYILVNKQ
jgi:hypothetical protein